MKKKLFVFLIPILLITISLFPRKENKELVSNTDNLVSFTVDGVESKTMPTKGSGYIANKITCKNGSIITFDNDNYIIEVEKLESADACKIDFSKEIGSNTVTVTISNRSKIDSTSKTTTEGGKVVFYLTGEPESITGGEYTLSSNKLIVNNIISNINLNITMSKTLYDQLLIDNSTIKTRTDFDTTFTETNTGTLYKATESIAGNTPKDVYYFAGDAKNNWVKFAGFYWRIIRTNDDGSIRLLYSGTSHNTTSGYIWTSAFNSPYNDPMHVGYMYGTTGSLENNRLNTNNSAIKTYIDNWYKNNLSSYSKYISTEAVYCNDRELAPGSTYNTGNTSFGYATKGRLNTNKTPTYNCTNIKDAFSGSNSEAKLTYPIGLMTADEIAYAGGKEFTSLPSPYAWYYLNSAGESITGSTYWWSLSPFGWSGSYSTVWVVFVSSNPGYLSYIRANDTSYGVRPAISLKTCIKYSTGNGAPETPYEIILDPDISC
ncbi:unknown [Clostridium sp. CAG:628]|nr:unknown [Clostridium sp. CAG:628]